MLHKGQTMVGNQRFRTAHPPRFTSSKNKRRNHERFVSLVVCQGTASAVPKSRRTNPALAAEVLFPASTTSNRVTHPRRNQSRSECAKAFKESALCVTRSTF